MITKHLNRSELILALKADGLFDERPDLAKNTLSGTPYISKDVMYVLAGSEASRRELASRAAPASPGQSPAPATSPTARFVSDEEAERRIDAIEARRKVAPTPISSPTPAATPMVAEKRAERAAIQDAGTELALMAMRGMNETDDSIEYLFRDAASASTERASATPENGASAQLVELAMRGVNDGSQPIERVSRDPGADLLKLATQGLPAMQETPVSHWDDGPEAA